MVDLTQDPPRSAAGQRAAGGGDRAVLGASLKAENPGGSTAFSPKTSTEIVSAADLAALR
ncbi:MAG: hypothetical protein R3F39_06715 [Myxococcota bacterium]